MTIDSSDFTFHLGRNYLVEGRQAWKLAMDGVDTEESKRRAVNSYLSAALEGSDEAVEFLRGQIDCNSTGIKDENRSEVEWCTKVTSSERKLYGAAKKLFCSINLEKKEDLCIEEFNAAVDKLLYSRENKSLLKATAKRLHVINQKTFTTALMERFQGKVSSREDIADLEGYKNCTLYQKIRYHPATTAKVTFEEVSGFLAANGSTIAKSAFPVKQMYLLVTLIVYSYVTSSLLLNLIPPFIFYLSYIMMILSTIAMMNKRHRLSDIDTWGDILRYASVNVDVNEVKSQFQWNSLRVYGAFFLSLFCTISGFGLSEKSFIPCSEICVASVILSLVTFIALSDKYEKLVVISMCANILSSLSVLTSHAPNNYLLRTFVNLMADPIFSIHIGPLVKVNFGVAALLYAIIPIVFISMAFQQSWKGTYKILIPHLVCYCWWNFAVVTFSFTSWFGLARASITVFFLPVIIPLSVIIFIIYGFIIFFKIIQSDLFAKIFVTAIIFALCLLLVFRKSILKSQRFNRFSHLKKVIVVLLGFSTLVPMTLIKSPILRPTSSSKMSWLEFSKTCIDNPTSNNFLDQQIFCSNLNGVAITWSGVVNSVKIHSTMNKFTNVLDSLPRFISSHLRCLYGERFNCINESNGVNHNPCFMSRYTANLCSLQSHDIYTFRLLVNMPSGVVFTLTADHKFREILQELQSGDTINFTATLSSGLGTSYPSADLRSLTCLSREITVTETHYDQIDSIILTKFNDFMSVVFNFVWFPLAEYVPQKEQI